MSEVEAAIQEMFQAPHIQVMRSCSKLSKVFLAAMVHELYKTGMSETTFEKLAQTVSCLCTSNGITFPGWDTLLRIGCKLGESRIVLCESGASHRLQKLQLNFPSDDVSFALKDSKDLPWLTKAQRFANTHDHLALMANTQTPFHPDHSSLITYIQHLQPNNNFVPQPSFNTNYMQQSMQNLEDISDLTTAIDMTLALMAKEFTINNTTPTNNNQRSSLNPSNMQIAQPGMNMDQDRQMLMVEENVGNQFRPNAVQNVGNQVVQNAIQNSSIQIVENMNGLSVVLKVANQYGNRNVVTTSAKGNGNGINDANEETERVKANCILENNLQQASTSGTQSDKAHIYDLDGSSEVHLFKNCHDNDIFNMFTQEKQYTELLEPISEPHQVPQNDSNVVYEVSSMEQDDTTPSVARKFLNKVKSTIVTLQGVVKQKMTLDIHNWSSSTHQEIYKSVKDEIFPIVNQVDARLQNFEIQFLKEAAKFVRDFKSLAKEADESLAKHKALELEIVGFYFILILSYVGAV
nr:origin of replication complex subunit 1A-like [Tanacetum cinerariifolium]